MPSARILIALSLPILLALAAAATAGEPPAEPGAGRVVLVPLNLGVPTAAEIEPGLDPVWQAMLQHFGSEGRRIAALERSGATSLWNEVMADARAEGGANDVYQVYRRFAQRVAEQVEYETIVFPSLVTRVATVRGRQAAWDRVSRLVVVPGMMQETIEAWPEGDIRLSRSGATGELAAVSLHVALFSADGVLRFEGKGGLALLQQIKAATIDDGSELRVAARPDAFANAADLHEGIAAAFEQSPLPASPAH